MSRSAKYIIAVSETEKFQEHLATVLGSDYGGDRIYPLNPGGNVWVIRSGAGGSASYISKRMHDHYKKQCKEKKEEIPAFTLFETNENIFGYYYSSLWDWVKGGSDDK